MTYTPLPIGIDDFEEIITKEYYYVDKTWLIKELLDKKGKVNLFTRPQRFGKTLNLSMIRYFFERPQDGESYKHLFDGLKIMDAGEKYVCEQEQYSVIMLTLKSAKQIHEDITYEDIHTSEDNLWNFLFFTGYLKAERIRMERVTQYVTMSIPNNELLYIYENTITNWFRDAVNTQDLQVLYTSLLDGTQKSLRNS